MEKKTYVYVIKSPKKKLYICILILLLLSVNNVFGDEFTLEHTLDNYIKFALDNNSMLNAAHKMINVKKYDKILAKKIPNPSVMGMVMPTNDDSRYGFGKATVSQMFPYPGKLTAKRNVAQKSVEVLEMGKKYKEIMLVNNVRTAYVSLYTIGKKIEYTKISLGLLAKMESVMLSKYASAMGSQMALLKLQTKMAIIENQIINMEEKGNVIRFKMESMLNSSSARDFPYPDTLPPLEVPRDYKTVRDISLVSNPLILKHKKRVNEAESMIKAAKQVFAPDLMISGSFTRAEFAMGMAPKMEDMSGMKGEWSAGFSVLLPIWAKTNKAKIDKAREMLNVEKSMLKQEELNLARDASVFLTELEDTERQINLLDNVLIPKAKQTLELVSQMYKIGQTSILDFLDSDKMLLDLQIKRVEYVKKRELLAAEIVICCLARY